MYKVVLIIVIIFVVVPLLISLMFQKKKNKKYTEVLKMLKDKVGKTINEVYDIDIKGIDDDKLMRELYDIYMKFQKRVNDLNSGFDDILVGNFKEYYNSLIESYKEKKYKDIVSNIDLIGYSIVSYNEPILDFRIKMSCISYKIIDDTIVSGSNINKIEKVLVVTYEKKDKWYIKDIKNLYESKIDSQN